MRPEQQNRSGRVFHTVVRGLYGASESEPPEKCDVGSKCRPPKSQPRKNVVPSFVPGRHGYDSPKTTIRKRPARRLSIRTGRSGPYEKERREDRPQETSPGNDFRHSRPRTKKHSSHEHDDGPTAGTRTRASRAEVSLPNTFRIATKKRTEKLPSGTSTGKARMGETPISLPDASIKIIGAEYRPPSGRPRWPPSR